MNTLKQEIESYGLNNIVIPANELAETLINTERDTFVSLSNPDNTISVSSSKDIMQIDAYIDGENYEVSTSYDKNDINIDEIELFIEDKFTDAVSMSSITELGGLIDIDIYKTGYEAIKNEDNIEKNNEFEIANDNKIDEAAYDFAPESDYEPLTDTDLDNISNDIMPENPNIVVDDEEIETYNWQDEVDKNETFKEEQKDEDVSIKPSASEVLEYTGILGKMVDVGYIPPYITSAQNKTSDYLSKDNISVIRNSLPDFGKMLGSTVDTTKSAKLYGVELKQISPYLKVAADKIQFANVYVSEGEKFKVNIDKGLDIKSYHPANIITFEFKLVDESEKKYEIFTGNDLGKLYTRLPISTCEFVNTNNNISFLDKTNIDAPRHFFEIDIYEKDSFGKTRFDEKNRPIPVVDNEGNKLHISDDNINKIKDVLNEKNESLLDNISDKIEKSLNDKEPVMRYEKEKFDENSSALGNVLNNTEFVKDVLGTEIVEKINETDAIADKIVDLTAKMESKDNTVNYKDLEKEYNSLKVDYYNKIEEIKDFVKDSNYLDVTEKVNMNREAYSSSLDISEPYSKHYSSIYSDKKVEDEGKGEQKFNRLSQLEGMPLSVAPKDVTISDKYEDKAITYKQDKIDSWNEKAENKDMQLHLDKETGCIWTEYGTKVDILLNKPAVEDDGRGKANVEFDRNQVDLKHDEKNLNNLGLIEVRNGYEPKSYAEYLENNVPGTDIKIGSIGELFVSKEVFKDIDRDKIDSLSKGTLDKIDYRLLDKLENAGFGKTDIANDVKIEAKGTISKEDKTDKDIEKEKELKDEDNVIKPRVTEKDITDKLGDINKPVELSDKSIEKIIKSAHGDVIKEKHLTGEAISKLEQCKNVIKAYSMIVDKFKDTPAFVNANSPVYSYANVRLLESIREYQKLGGKIGDDSLVKAPVTRCEIVENSLRSWSGLSRVSGGLITLIINDFRITSALKHDFKDMLKDIAKADADLQKVETGISPIEISDKTDNSIIDESDNIDNNKLEEVKEKSDIEDNNALEKPDTEENDNIEKTNSENDNTLEKTDTVDNIIEKSDVEDNNISKKSDNDVSDNEEPKNIEKNANNTDLDNNEKNEVENKEVDKTNNDEFKADIDNFNNKEDVEEPNKDSPDKTDANIKEDIVNISEDETDVELDNDSKDEVDEKNIEDGTDDKTDRDKDAVQEIDKSDLEEKTDEDAEDPTDDKKKDYLEKESSKDDAAILDEDDSDSKKDTDNEDIKIDEDVSEDLKNAIYEGDTEKIADIITENTDNITVDDLIEATVDAIENLMEDDDEISSLSPIDLESVGACIDTIADTMADATDYEVKAEDVRDGIFNEMLEQGFSQTDIDKIEDAVLEYADKITPDTDFVLQYNGILLDEIIDISNGTSDINIDKISNEVDNAMHNPDFTDYIKDSLYESEIADSIKEKLEDYYSDSPVTSSQINDLVENKMNMDIDNGVFLSADDFSIENYIDLTLNDLSNYIDDMLNTDSVEIDINDMVENVSNTMGVEIDTTDIER